MQITLTIVSSYAKVYEELATKIQHALADGDVPQAYRQELLKQAFESSYEFVDSVVNAGKYTRNEALIREIQELFMDKAIEQYDLIFDEFSKHTKSWSEVASAKE